MARNLEHGPGGGSQVPLVPDVIKFPKTPRLAHVLKEDIHRAWRHHTAVVEEKVDGANVGIWFEGEELRLQSRGHVLRGGAGERQFAAFHGWAGERRDALLQALSERFVLYGEWCFAKNKSFYDALPDWFIGYDLFDRTSGKFLTTPARDVIFKCAGIHIVPRIWTGAFSKATAFGSLLGLSRFKTPRWREALAREAARVGVKNPLAETDDSDMAEGVYIRIEDHECVLARMKLHREGYEKVRNDHWREQALIRNIRL